MGWGGRWEGIQDEGTHVYLWLIHVIYEYIWQKPPKYCKVISLQLKKKKKDPCAHGKSPVGYTLGTEISGINMHIKLCNFGIIFQVVLLKILQSSIPVGSG